MVLAKHICSFGIFITGVIELLLLVGDRFSCYDCYRPRGLRSSIMILLIAAYVATAMLDESLFSRALRIGVTLRTSLEMRPPVMAGISSD